MDIRFALIVLAVAILGFVAVFGLDRTEMNNMDDPEVARATNQTIELIGGAKAKRNFEEAIRRADEADSDSSSDSESSSE